LLSDLSNHLPHPNATSTQSQLHAIHHIALSERQCSKLDVLKDVELELVHSSVPLVATSNPPHTLSDTLSASPSRNKGGASSPQNLRSSAHQGHRWTHLERERERERETFGLLSMSDMHQPFTPSHTEWEGTEWRRRDNTWNASVECIGLEDEGGEKDKDKDKEMEMLQRIRAIARSIVSADDEGAGAGSAAAAAAAVARWQDGAVAGLALGASLGASQDGIPCSTSLQTPCSSSLERGWTLSGLAPSNKHQTNGAEGMEGGEAVRGEVVTGELDAREMAAMHKMSNLFEKSATHGSVSLVRCVHGKSKSNLSRMLSLRSFLRACVDVTRRGGREGGREQMQRARHCHSPKTHTCGTGQGCSRAGSKREGSKREGRARENPAHLLIASENRICRHVLLEPHTDSECSN